MRCGHPNTAEGVAEAIAAGAERAIALPLYPQWANATTRSSLEELRRVWPRERPLVEICTWHDDPGYLDALAATVREALARLPAGVPRLVVFSAHGLPMSAVRKGDPYPEYVLASSRGAAERCGLAEGEWKVTYQSKVGPTKWLGPDTMEWIEANVRGKALVTVPVAFVSEHLETLYDLDVLAKEASQKGGAAFYARAPALGVRPDFVAALADLVRRALVSPPARVAAS
jgi:ferrochelatase